MKALLLLFVNLLTANVSPAQRQDLVVRREITDAEHLRRPEVIQEPLPCSYQGIFRPIWNEAPPEYVFGSNRCDRSGRCAYGLILLDLELALGPRCSPVHLLATPLASLLSMHRVPWRLDT